MFKEGLKIGGFGGGHSLRVTSEYWGFLEKKQVQQMLEGNNLFFRKKNDEGWVWIDMLWWTLSFATIGV